MAISTLSKFTVPLANDQSSASQGLLMPKLQYRFRAVLENFGVSTPRSELTKQVIDITRPNLTFDNVTTRIEMLDGGNGASAPNVLDTFELYGAYVENVNYNTLAYATSDPATITMSIRYDNAIQTPTGTGIGTAVSRTIGTLSTGGGQ